MMTPSERDFALNQLDQTRERLLRAAQGLSREQLLYRPEPGRWSVADNVEHLVVAEGRLIGLMEKLLQEPPDLITRSALDDGQVVAKVGTVESRVQSPEHALPTSRWSTEDLLPEFEKTRQRTRNFVSTTDGDLRHHFVRHFLFGDLDCYQWFLLIGAHCNRHSAQSEAVIASPGFPRQNERTAAR
ncbi:MAG TPA: DinB family protein [Candidatus Saccharimonadales bacterium]|jgi:uncharacterized damage-inducible protein DinB|nr:DinB family protein [Candidatus Saccharimonadales bacterium]